VGGEVGLARASTSPSAPASLPKEDKRQTGLPSSPAFVDEGRRVACDGDRPHAGLKNSYAWVRSSSCESMLTSSQRHVFETLVLYGEAFFAREFGALKIKPRLFPLIVGPTGAGKSFLVRNVAEQLDAHYFRLTFGDWLPRGVRADSGGQTAFTIISTVLEESRVVLHIDELDKMREDYEHQWTRSVANDVWNVLDGILPVRDYYKARNQAPSPEQIRDTEALMREQLWIVGSGTWQSVFEENARRPLGFAKVDGGFRDTSHVLEKIRAIKAIPEELLARFSSSLLLLQYPDSDAEKHALLEQSGILALAARAGRPIHVSDLDFNQGGMRRLESLATDLLLELRRQRKIRTSMQRKRIPASRPLLARNDRDPGDLFEG